MSKRDSAGWGLKAISVFYLVGIVAVTITLLANRATVGEQLAAVHGLPALAGAPAMLLTIVMGVLVVVGINSMRAWGYWLTMAYMAFLLVFPPLALGKDGISLFANVLWPLFMVVYLYVKRSAFGVGRSRVSGPDADRDIGLWRTRQRL